MGSESLAARFSPAGQHNLPVAAEDFACCEYKVFRATTTMKNKHLQSFSSSSSGQQTMIKVESGSKIHQFRRFHRVWALVKFVKDRDRVKVYSNLEPVSQHTFPCSRSLHPETDHTRSVH